jgi:microsomal epoxide hydrolase
MPTPFKIDVPQEKIDRILARVRGTTWPKAQAGEGLAYGVDISYMRALADHWVNAFNWREAENALNQFDQYTADVTVEGETLNLHFYHVRSPREDARALILSHGWPGSVFEFLHLIEPLTNPPAGEPAFHVVVPSLPGYGFSEAPSKPISPRRIGAYFASLMTNVLGYDSFLAQGGDWGGLVSAAIALDCPACTGLHINIYGWWSPGVGPETEEEKAHAAQAGVLEFFEGAYFRTQAAKPMSLGLALEDSPVGFAGWVVEKWNTWSHTEGDLIESVYTKDQMLTNIMIYLVTETVTTALWPYRGVLEDGYGGPIEPGTKITVPTAIAKFPFEVPLYAFPPRSQVERSYGNLVQWSEFPAGGHFAAMEQPEALIADIRQFAEALA